MLINDISEKCNISIGTLRYYDKIGLLCPKRKNKIRDYTESDVENLKAIITMKNMMFSLDEIKFILNLDETIDNQIRNNNVDITISKNLSEVLKTKYQEMESIEQDIIQIKSMLNHFIKKVNGLISKVVDKNE